MISQWIPWASAASEDASPVSVPPAISLELAGRCCFSWLIGTVVVPPVQPPETPAAQHSWRPPSCCACCGWGVRQTTCTCGRKHAAYCSIQAQHGTHAQHPISKKDGFPQSLKITNLLFKNSNIIPYYPIFTWYLPPVTTSSSGLSMVYLWFLHG